MKLLTATAILCMLGTAPVYAQQNHDDKPQETSKAPERNGKQAEKPASKSPEKPADHASKPEKEAAVKTESAPLHQEKQQQEQAREAQKTEQKAQQSTEKAQEKQEKNQKQQAERQAKNETHDQNHGHAEAVNNARGENGGRRIPEERYRADFGRAHTFHVRHDNDRRFQFGGYWFEYTEAWPSDWGYDDDFYIVEIDGVDYLCDARFPDQRIVVVVTA